MASGPARALIEMAAEGSRCAAALDGSQHAKMLPGRWDRFFSIKLRPAARMMSATSKGGAVICCPVCGSALYCFGSGTLSLVDRRACGLQMTLRTHAFKWRLLSDRSVASRQLHVIGKFRSNLQQPVAKLWRSKWGDLSLVIPAACAASRHSLPEHSWRNRLIGSPVVYRAREQIRPGLHPAPVLAQSLEPFRTEWHIAITVPFAVPDMDDHTCAVIHGELRI